ncbi:VOC family protein [Streptomyces sp. NBC_00569]|uniref:VOC family protein n=1 Tax=Streptomyces sp. NBC_00569 TaxID=2975780 RepID=UPI002E81E736|nr:VOC family protein [Streptomyces sp. NBC_00569]WUB99199.1 VOC family protein [Streptomyces sp. NBC_00569]
MEAPDSSGLAKFCAELLGWHIAHEELGTAIVAASPQGPFFVFHQADAYGAPVWPPAEGEQRPMMHFDFRVGDLDSAFAEAALFSYCYRQVACRAE